MKFDLHDVELVGRDTPDPLRFAFQRKKSAHAGGMTRPITGDAIQSSLQKAHALVPSDTHAPRCLYIHIPFCRVRCTYCNFFQYASSKSLIDTYMEALREEIRWKAAEAWTQAAPFQAVYIGGGTPTDLSAGHIHDLVSDVRRHFPLTPDCETTLEGRVNRFGLDKFEAALEAGVNRFSFGVQSFNTDVRKSAKRFDDRDTVLETINRLASYNAAPIVLDLLYGLPHQTLEIWQQDLHDYLDSGAHGVDLYQLIEMQGLPMARMVEQGKLPHPADTQMKASMFEMGVAFMAKHHQRRLSVNHWASDNRERSIYNSLAKTTAEIMPLGAGAGGNINGCQMMQNRDMDSYIAAIKAKQHPVTMLMMAPADKAVSAMIKSGFDAGVLSQRQLDRVAGAGMFQALTPLFAVWQKNGLVTLEQDGQHGYLSLTLAGQFWAVTLAQNLIEVLQNNNTTMAA
ncbi:heme anaerobic degradation radical SAM methyltransferase ChuW/HutW [Photobacterium aphoticum]|uniref:Coproporphyrinogen III oxidase n=1 Tax=Photobacterium aphoticum TaxID=754436 RepID=A0A0J1JI86_9GAMM|nr:heme anaerobic degradation radical SAM methyltransferase ChuW/HutW [Photobacterium aphoticum]KLV01657.1 coproporphyrinogen III oxidase [Photobacterium aphoticum]PSU59229.1 heme anaerobic degradation radical SAM methyltransferase ChuW/HutW [Photobacterium aphoticum]GHA31159.1 putative heme utilization radical SAM enzyme HutW [Photobacterium aphoticum]